MPDLAERREDIMLYADFFLDQANRELDKHVVGFDPEAEKLLVTAVLYQVEQRGRQTAFVGEVDRFMDLATFSEIKPMVNQLETHVFQQHKNDKKFLERYGTKLEAWAPFARGSQGIFENEVLMKIAKQHNKTIGQVALRFLIQNGIIAIPKSTHKNRMEENFNIFDFSLSDEEMKKIEELDLGENVFMNHENAEDIDKFFKMFHVGQK